MNIFYLDHNPRLAAEYQCDKHVVKMILESAQLLCTAHHRLGSGEEWMYKETHVNHPSAIWVRESVQNYRWLWTHAIYLCAEYTFRYDKTHKTEGVLEMLREPPQMQRRKRTPVKQALPTAYKQSCPVQAYRIYYAKDKRPLLTYKRRPMPAWLEEML